MATDDVGKAEEISPRAIWLDEGHVRADGPTRDVLGRFLEPRVSPGPLDPPGDVVGARLAAVQLLGEDGAPATAYFPGDPITVAVELELEHRVDLPYFLVSIAGEFGPIASANMFLDGQRPPFVEGRYGLECRFDGLVLAPGQTFTVRLALYAGDGATVVYSKRVIGSFVMGGSAAAAGFLHDKAEGRIRTTGPVLADYSWRLPGLPDARFTASRRRPANEAREAAGAAVEEGR
jgi:hypothetical protein